MSIPKNITKSHVEKAINEIQVSKIPKERLSYNYFLVENGKELPPKYVICIANKYANNHELKGNEFNAVQAQLFLKKLGFNIIQKNQDSTNVWFVCQGTTFTDEFGKKYLWAPKLDKAGNPKFFWENMKRVKRGDIIFNYSKGIKGVSLAINDCYDSNNTENQSSWGKEGFRVDIDFFEFDKDIKIEDLKSIKGNLQLALNGIEKKPFNSNGGVNQGYLYEFSPEAGKLIIDKYGKSVGNEVIDKYFNNINKPEIPPSSPGNNTNFIYSEFNRTLINSGLLFSPQLTTRFISSLLTKPFVILTGLSGSGKTKLAQAFSRWICQDENQYCVVPVGADWTNREPLLGYPNALKPDEYVKPDNGVLDLIIHANENRSLPYFLILDEMNLSHVERYFADFLSVMESDEEIPLFAEGAVSNGVPAKLNLPDNLFIIGTVNIDETTYMFSPKVLDRANTIEFRVNEDEIEYFLNNKTNLNLGELTGRGSSMAKSFIDLSRNKTFDETDKKEINKTLLVFFKQLKKAGAEFGYRSANEISRLINQLNAVDSGLSADEKLDVSIMQKLLPKLHGSRRKLCPVLITLGGFCVTDKIDNIEKEIFDKEVFDFNDMEKVKYPLSLEKITRMYKGAVDNGFASYAEA